MINYLKKMRKLCDEATPGPWVWQENREKERADVMYVEPHSDGSGFGQYDLISRDSGVYGPDVKTCEYIMAHSPDVMKLVWDVVEAADLVLDGIPEDSLKYAGEICVSPGLLLELKKVLKALQNKVGK